MGEEVGTMQFRVQGKQIKNEWKKGKDEYKEKINEGKYVWERKNMSL
jgi:hypothetical protein